MRLFALRLALVLTPTSVLLPHPAAAQPVLDVEQRLDFDRTESWAMKYFTSVALFTGLGAPRALAPGELEVGVEVDWVPALSAAERTVGFNGTKTEDLDKTEVFGRPRLTVGLPGRVTLTGSYVPPVELFGVEPHLVAVAFARPLAAARRFRLGGRLYFQYGTLEGDFTCSDEDAAGGDDPVLNPFRCEAPSSDEMTLRAAGFELSAAFPLAGPGAGGGRLEPYLAIGATTMDLDFRVDARYSGIIDRTLLLTDGETLYATAGLTYRTGRRTRLAAEAFYTPLDVVRPPDPRTRTESLLNLRLLASYRLR